MLTFLRNNNIWNFLILLTGDHHIARPDPGARNADIQHIFISFQSGNFNGID